MISTFFLKYYDVTTNVVEGFRIEKTDSEIVTTNNISDLDKIVIRKCENPTFSEDIIELPGRYHWFEPSTISTWELQKSTCPNCRRAFLQGEFKRYESVESFFRKRGVEEITFINGRVLKSQDIDPNDTHKLFVRYVTIWSLKKDIEKLVDKPLVKFAFSIINAAYWSVYGINKLFIAVAEKVSKLVRPSFIVFISFLYVVDIISLFTWGIAMIGAGPLSDVAQKVARLIVLRLEMNKPNHTPRSIWQGSLSKPVEI